jgi:hypothetical protein
MKILHTLLWLLVLSMAAIPSTILATTLSSLTCQYPDVTLGANPYYTVVSTSAFLSVTPYCLVVAVANQSIRG